MNGLVFQGMSGLLLIAAKGAVVLSASAVAVLALRRASAAARHRVWFLGMAALIALPFVEVVAPRWAVEVPEEMLNLLPREARDRAATVALSSAAQPVVGASIRRMDDPFPQMPSMSSVPNEYLRDAAPDDAARLGDTPTVASMLERARAFLFWIWMGGAAFLLLTLLAGLVTLARLARRCRPFAEGRVTALNAELALAMGIRERIPVLQGPLHSMPMSWGLVQRVILLPEEAEHWEEFPLRAVLRHELSHVRRRDCLTQAVAEVSLALHWLNPLAWLAARRLRVEREHACDDLVVLGGARPSDYALTLIELAKGSRPLPTRVRVAAAMARPVQLNGRLRAILDEDRPRSGSPLGRFTTALLALILVVAVAAFTPAAVPPSTLDEQATSGLDATSPVAMALERTFEIHVASVDVDVAKGPATRSDQQPLDGASASAAESFGVVHTGGEVELAQIRGHITDVVTGAPLADAQVRRAGSEVVAISSESGAYALIDVPAGTYELRVERVGYAPQTRSVALTQDAVLETDFALTPEAAVEIAPVTVTPPAGAAGIPRRDSVRLREPGNTITQTQPRPIIYIDGVRVSPPDTTVLDDLSPDEIEKVEVIRGAAAVGIYGEEARAGVIQIFLKKPPIDTLATRQLPDLDSLVSSMSIRIRLGGTQEARLIEPLVLVDDVRYDGEARRALFQSLTPEQIDRIEVMKGRSERFPTLVTPAVRRFGSAAERGAILIYRKRP